MRFRELGPHRSGSWEVEIGTLGEYLRGKKILHSEEFVLLGVVKLLSPALLREWLARLLTTEFLTG